MRSSSSVGFASLAIVAVALIGVACWRTEQPPSQNAPPPLLSAQSASPERPQDPTPPGPNAIVFSLAYRGVTPEETTLWTGAATGWGSHDSDDSKYIQRLKKTFNIRPIKNANLTGREWTGLEITDDKVLALHIDLNGNEKPDEGERILPATIPATHYFSRSNYTFFFTPDMMLPSDGGGSEPYRMVLRVKSPDDNCPMWSGGALWTAEGDIDGERYALALHDGSLRSGFRNFGRAKFSLQKPGQDKDASKRLQWQTLSRIVHVNDRFMRLRFLGKESDPDGFRLVLEPYTGSAGKLQPEIVTAHGNRTPASCSYVRLDGESDEDVHFGFTIEGGPIEAPSGTYNLAYARLSYGITSSETWTCQVSDYAGVEVGAGDTRALPLGPPAMNVIAIDANRRHSSSAKSATEFPAEMTVYLSPEVQGPHGETFGRFYSMKQGGRKRVPANPSLLIKDSAGNTVASETMEYG